jgi:flagellar protein FliT
MPAMQCRPDVDDVAASEILALYRQLRVLTARMRQAAADADWDALIALESECAGVSCLLIACEDGSPRTAEYQRKKADLIREVLEDDAQIRQSVNARMTGLWRLIDGRGQVKKLNAAYGTNSGIPRGPAR